MNELNCNPAKFSSVTIADIMSQSTCNKKKALQKDMQTTVNFAVEYFQTFCRDAEAP